MIRAKTKVNGKNVRTVFGIDITCMARNIYVRLSARMLRAKNDITYMCTWAIHRLVPGPYTQW
jgi:hypothetical protein